MSDIVERLHIDALEAYPDSVIEINTLRAENKRLRDALVHTAEALAWLHRGELRGFSDVLLPVNEALCKAITALKGAPNE